MGRNNKYLKERKFWLEKSIDMYSLYNEDEVCEKHINEMKQDLDDVNMALEVLSKE